MTEKPPTDYEIVENALRKGVLPNANLETNVIVWQAWDRLMKKKDGQVDPPNKSKKKKKKSR